MNSINTSAEFYESINTSIQPLLMNLGSHGKALDVNLLSDKFDEYMSKIPKNGFEQLIAALKDEEQLLWGNSETWLQYRKFLIEEHYKKNYILNETPSFSEDRLNFLKSLFFTADQLLWMNLGLINDLYRNTNSASDSGNVIAETFKRAIIDGKKEPNIILTFGWPEDILGPYSEAKNKCEEIKEKLIGEVPLFKFINEYGSKSKKVLIVALQNRIDNHFGMSIDSKNNVNIGFELLHNEDQEDRWMIRPKVSESKFIEAGIILRHLMFLSEKKSSSFKSFNYKK